MNVILKNFLIFLLVFLIIAGIFSLINIPQKKPVEVSLNKIAEEIDQGKIKTINIEDNRINIILKNVRRKKT